MMPASTGLRFGHLRKKGYINIFKIKGQTLYQVNGWRKVQFVFGLVDPVTREGKAKQSQNQNTNFKKENVKPISSKKAQELAEALEEKENISFPAPIPVRSCFISLSGSNLMVLFPMI